MKSVINNYKFILHIFPNFDVEIFRFVRAFLRARSKYSILLDFKVRFLILKLIINYSIKKKICMSIIFCILHNFIIIKFRNDIIFNKFVIHYIIYKPIVSSNQYICSINFLYKTIF